MPFANSALVPLIQTTGFTLWHYRSGDLRADITAPGYFAAAAPRLRPGDMMVLQSLDAMAILPVRSNAVTGPGVTLDGAVTPIALTRVMAQPFSMTQAATAVVRTIILAPLLAGIVVGTSIPVQAQVVGPISQVVVSLRDSAGRLVPPSQTVTVSQGYANVALPTPPVGTGYRIRVEDALDGSVAATSRSFNILPDLRLLLTETAGVLLQEDGAALAQN